jgi:DNA-binding NtrC family response regulator
MDRRGILIADRDARYRSSLARFLKESGYRVETTDTIEDMLECALEKQVSVLLLGSDFGLNIESADLVHLLKLFQDRLKIILVTDDLTLAQARRVRNEGIFYHALKPATPDDLAELGQAVGCAFGKPQSKRVAPDAEPGDAAPAVGAERQAQQLPLRKALPCLAALAAIALGAGYLSQTTAQSMRGASSLATWIFLAFCALIIVGQSLPILRVKLALKWRHALQTVRGALQGGGK